MYSPNNQGADGALTNGHKSVEICGTHPV